MTLINPDWRWSAEHGLLVHLADPIESTFTLCGIETEREAPEDARAIPALRCRNCSKLLREAEQGEPE